MVLPQTKYMNILYWSIGRKFQVRIYFQCFDQKLNIFKTLKCIEITNSNLCAYYY